MTAVPTDSCALAGLPVSDIGADNIDAAGNLVVGS
jgi:hypothetical protein